MLKKLLSFLLAFILCLSFNINTFAQEESISDGEYVSIPSVENAETGCDIENNSASTFSTGTYKKVGQKRFWGLVRYYDYICYKHTSSWYLMTGLNLTMALYHSKNSGNKSLAFTMSQTYSSETAKNFSVGAGADAGIGDMVKASVELGYGVTKTTKREYQASSTIQATIPASANTGYYKMQICHNFYQMKITRQRTDGTEATTHYMAIPYGTSYAAVLYSSSTASGTWSKW